MKFNDIEEALRRAEGNLKHEGMFITEEERDIIRLKSKGDINQKEFIQKLIDLHKSSMRYEGLLYDKKVEELKEVSYKEKVHINNQK